MNGEGVKDLAFTDKAYRARYLRDSSLEAISIVENAIKTHNLTLVETAFRWLVHHSALVMKKSEGGNEYDVLEIFSYTGVELGKTNADNAL